MCYDVFIFSPTGPSGADCWDGRSSWWAEESPGCRSCRALSHQGLDEDLGWRFGDLIWSRWDGEFVASKKLSPNENPNVNGMTTERFSWKKHVLTMTKCALKSFQLLERFFFAGFGTKTWLLYESRIPFESRQTKADKRRRSLTQIYDTVVHTCTCAYEIHISYFCVKIRQIHSGSSNASYACTVCIKKGTKYVESRGMLK